MEKFVRPALCRLCECPAGSDGVRVSDVDIVKLSRWWEKVLETEFEDEELEKKFFCQFCLWDAKFGCKDSDDCDWWTHHDTNIYFRRNYYEEKLIWPCTVRIIDPLSRDSHRDSSVVGGVRGISAWKPTKCIYCGAGFNSKSAAYRHALNSHGDSVKFSCKTCFLNFLSEKERKMHYQAFHPKRICCHVCEKMVQPAALLSHIYKNHFSATLTSFQCCGELFVNHKSLGNHFKMVRHNRKGLCVYCKKGFRNKYDLGRHVKTTHPAIAIKCQYFKCRKYFVSESQKQEHLSEVHENVAGRVMCLYCECKFSKSGMSRHILMRHQSQAIRCSHCPTYFKTEILRKEHEREKHFKTKLVQKLKCLECDKAFYYKNGLLEHTLSWHKLELKLCKSRGCWEYFRSDSELRNHFEEKHSTVKARETFKCNECNYKTHLERKHKRHFRDMHKPGNFSCSTCSLVFQRNGDLRNHVGSAHARKRCLHCGEAYRNLHQHLKLTPCKECSFVAPCKSLRKLHCKKCRKS